jgi:shikimate O-hydroxycinnamoyltransferase
MIVDGRYAHVVDKIPTSVFSFTAVTKFERCVQVTFLKCGGVVLGTGIHHVTMDGMGAFHFIQTWTGVARGLNAAEVCGALPPFHDWTLLCARSPPTPTFDHLVYSPALLNGRPRPFVTRVYAVSPKLLPVARRACPRTAPSPRTCGAACAWRTG